MRPAHAKSDRLPRLDHRPAPRRILIAGLATIALLVSIDITVRSVMEPIWGVDVVVPLRAATRWLAGGEPYLASAFTAGTGYDVPFLYAPPFLVAFAPLTLAPVQAVVVAASVVGALACYAALRRLGMRPVLVLLVLLWPPFSGLIAGGNLQALMFAAFVWLYWDPAARRAVRPAARDWRRPGRSALIDGVLASFIPAVKISQGQAWFGVLRLRPRAALIGAVVVAGVVAILLPVVGPSTWGAWLQQGSRAADPTWPLRGSSLTKDLPPAVTLAFAGMTMVAALFVPPRRAGAWIGLLTVIGTPGLRLYSVLFAVPAMLELRREIALVAAILIATYTFEGLWLGIAIVAICSAASERFPVLLEPDAATRPPGEPPQGVSGRSAA
jgi:hypothetical protein